MVLAVLFRVLLAVLLGLWWRSPSVEALPPAAPSGVRVDGVDDTSVTVSWGAVDDADRYTVTFTKTTTMETQQGVCIPAVHVVSVSVDAPSTSTSVGVGQMLAADDTTMLRAYTTYSITVVAVNGSGSSEDSDDIPVTTTQTRATAAPHNVMATVVNSTVITVQWDGLDPCRHVNGLIVLYRVQYTEVASGVVQSKDMAGEWDVMNVETSLTGLTPFTDYSIEVAAVNVEDEVGVYSDPLVRRTNEDRPGPVMINEPFPSFFKIRITWSPPERPNGIITEYEVSYGPTDSSQPTTTTNTSLETSFTTPSNLEPGTEFIFSVRASTSVGFGETASVTVSTLIRPSAVEGVTVTALNDTAVTVSWNAVIIPDFSVDFYTVVYSPVSQRRRRQDGGEMSAVFPSPATSGVIGGLDPDTDYQFQVFATVTVDGVQLEGERSVPAISEAFNESSTSRTTPLIIGIVIGVLVGTVV